MYLFWKSDCHCRDWYGPNMTPSVPLVTLNIQCLNKTIAQRKEDGWWGSIRARMVLCPLYLAPPLKAVHRSVNSRDVTRTFVMLKRIRTVTRSTSVEVYDRAIAITVEEHCLDFTAHFDSVCTVSVKNIHIVLNFVCRTPFSNKKKKKNEMRAKDMYVFLQVLRIIFKKEKSAIHVPIVKRLINM